MLNPRKIIDYCIFKIFKSELEICLYSYTFLYVPVIMHFSGKALSLLSLNLNNIYSTDVLNKHLLQNLIKYLFTYFYSYLLFWPRVQQFSDVFLIMKIQKRNFHLIIFLFSKHLNQKIKCIYGLKINLVSSIILIKRNTLDIRFHYKWYCPNYKLTRFLKIIILL